MDVISHLVFDARLLDAVARAALGSATCGVSTGAESRIHLLSSNLADQQRASDLLNSFGSLRVTASASALKTDETAPVISCRDDQIAADQQLGYLVLRGDEVVMRGVLDVAAGACSLTLSQPSAGAYAVFFYRLRGNFASGTVDIRINSA